MSWSMEDAAQAAAVTEGVVSVRIGRQAFGVPVLKVQDVIAQAAINLVPLAPPEVAGSLNLRGRIVTAVDMRLRLGMEPRRADESFMSVIVERNGELYALLVDDVGDVLWLPQSQHESTPATLSSHWRGVCSGLYRLEGELLLVLDIGEVLTLSRQASAPSTPAAPPPSVKPASTLFERLGGASGVEAAVSLFGRKVLSDPHVSRFFEGGDGARQAADHRAALTAFMGGPSVPGQGARIIVGEGLTGSHFDAVTGHLAATLRELGAAEADIVEVGALAGAARAEVLRR